MTASNKNMMLLLGLAAVGGAVWYFTKNGAGSLLPSTATPTYKKTNDSTIAEMKADLIGWRDRNDSGWNGGQPAIVEAVFREGEAAVRNLHALLWDIWQPGQVENYPFKVNSYLQPTSWDNSVGQWWVGFRQRNKV